MFSCNLLSRVINQLIIPSMELSKSRGVGRPAVSQVGRVDRDAGHVNQCPPWPRDLPLPSNTPKYKEPLNSCPHSVTTKSHVHLQTHLLSLHHESHRGRSYVSFLHCQQSDHFKPKTICLKLWWLSGKESACQCRRRGFNFWSGKIPWRRKQQPTLVFLPGESHGAWQAAVHGDTQSGT